MMMMMMTIIEPPGISLKLTDKIEIPTANLGFATIHS